MRWFLHLAGLILLLVAALLCWKTVDGSTISDGIAFGFLGLACWCASGLAVPANVP